MTQSEMNEAGATRYGTVSAAMEKPPVVLVPIFGAQATVFGFDPACDRIDLRETISLLDLEFHDARGGCTIVVKFGTSARQTLTLAGVARSHVSEKNFLNMAAPSRTSVVRRQVPRWSPAFPGSAGMASPSLA
ncbi:hypothetical protein RDV64_11815 [Acuticoccus sp. MNP-M23]|uniref:hypothetical protein n=1 Tax=Acuticoccus sp. MNP-M23 TaxID=3072793 RepID=UPI00281548C8|nr:hypothetical protein [Acuticoccus sp. MNP-M23]WMS40788.1 hypothetical protein RDV64_11815 [Acuticoccus sp. MNP-M23]